MSEYVFELFDSLFKTLHRQSRRVEELERRVADLERRLQDHGEPSRAGGASPNFLALVPQSVAPLGFTLVKEDGTRTPFLFEESRRRIFVARLDDGKEDDSR